MISRCPVCRLVSRVDASGISQVAWRSIPCLCRAPRPRPSRQVLTFSGLADAAPGSSKPKAPAGFSSRGLPHGFSTCCLRFTNSVAAVHARLASGWRAAPFTGRESNPLDRFERFRVTSVPLSRPSPDARKIENETFNVLKTDGYNLEHNFGHGKQNLAALLVTLNLLAFAFHTVCDQTEPLWRLARSKTSSRVQFFNRLAAITIYLIFPSWDDLLQTLAFTKPPPRPP